MKNSIKPTLFAALLSVVFPAEHRAQSTAFTYQGRIAENGQPLTGEARFQFTLWDALSNGSQIAATNPGDTLVSVTNGLFTVSLDFGSAAFDGANRWLEIKARTGTGAFTTLTPRQALASTPYALRALSLVTNGLASGTYASAVTFDNPANGFAGNGSELTRISSLDAADGSPADALSVDDNGDVSISTSLSVAGGLLSDGPNGGSYSTRNPNNQGASFTLGWLNDVARLRIGGAGAGASGGLDIQRSGDLSLLRILHNGNVGIGTAAPLAPLHVEGNVIVTNAQDVKIQTDHFSAGNDTLATGARSTAFGNTTVASADYSTALGNSTTASGYNSTAMGFNTTASGSASTAMGYFTDALGAYSTATGAGTTASGDYSLAMGFRADANHKGSFVWADSLNAAFVSSVANGFFARSTGGVKFVTGIDGTGNETAGMRITGGASAWSMLCDRDSKEHFAPVDTHALLERLAHIPIQTWNWKAQDDAIRHIGPMAQDFHAAFEVGEDERHISTVDFGGVALAAIQGLNQKLEETRAQNSELRRELQEIKQLLNKLTLK